MQRCSEVRGRRRVDPGPPAGFIHTYKDHAPPRISHSFYTKNAGDFLAPNTIAGSDFSFEDFGAKHDSRT